MFKSLEAQYNLSEQKTHRIAISKFIEFIEELIQETNFDYTQQLKIKVSDTNKIEQFLILYQNTFLFNQYMQFNWSGLSSGEQALLNLFSRFFSLSDSQTISNNGDLKRNIIVLIDEGELYFHPQWQKRMLSILLEYLPRVLSSRTIMRNIQILITSNSPFILSDLPTANAIFLEKKGEFTTVLDRSFETNKTFGANIYSLYADSFFIQEGLIGDFVKHKINDVVSLFLRGSESELYEKETYIKKIIDIIAEPVIRNKLLSLYKQKFVVDTKDKQREIYYLEKRLRTLKESNLDDKNK